MKVKRQNQTAGFNASPLQESITFSNFGCAADYVPTAKTFTCAQLIPEINARLIVIERIEVEMLNTGSSGVGTYASVQMRNAPYTTTGVSEGWPSEPFRAVPGFDPVLMTARPRYSGQLLPMDPASATVIMQILAQSYKAASVAVRIRTVFRMAPDSLGNIVA